MSYEIKSGIPLPPVTRMAGHRASKYPFADLDVGQMFPVPYEDDDPVVVARRLSQTARLQGLHLERKFSVRRLPDGVGVWRVK